LTVPISIGQTPVYGFFGILLKNLKNLGTEWYVKRFNIISYIKKLGTPAVSNNRKMLHL
jgi:hypothetical protein